MKGLKPLLTEDELSEMSEDEIKKVCYEHYLNDFIKAPFKINEKKLKVIEVNSKKPGFREFHETFTHIVTREYKSQEDRFFINERAIRIHWVKQILLAHPCKDIKYFKWVDERGNCREYFWYWSGKFMVILKDVTPDTMIVTAYCVDKEEELKYFEWFKLYGEGKSLCK